LGLNFIDTALAYGQGHSEQLVGRLLAERAGEIFVATKIPPKNHEWPARHGVSIESAFPKDHIIACTEQSLKNLGVDRLDLQQLHVWAENWTNDATWHETFLQLKQAGKIARFGISINDHMPDSALDLVRKGWVDSVQVIYNIFDPTPAEHLFPLCQEKQIGVIARCPFDEGALTGAMTETTSFEAGDWREDYFTPDRKREYAARLLPLRALQNQYGIASLAEMSLRFCLSHPAVSVVIPGMRTVAHVDANLAASDGHGLPGTLLSELATHAWPRNFYD